MKAIHTNQVKENLGSHVAVEGFVQTIRNQGSIIFILLRDVTGLIQVVVTKGSKEAFETASGLTLESVIHVHGSAKEEKQAPSGFEVSADEIKVLSLAEPELPIPVVVEKGGEEPEVSKRFDWRFLDLRRPEKKQIFKVWTSLEKGFREFFEKENFTQIYSPAFMSAASESGAEVFTVDYFDRKAYLAQSPQFYKQMAMAAGFERVFMVGPVFRAEPSYTTRHMTEFTGWDFEMSYVTSHHDVMDMVEGLFRSGVSKVTTDCDLKVEMPSDKFPRLTMEEAKAKLKKAGVPSEKDHDISPEEERVLCEIIKEETGHEFVFLIDYHKSVRAFYHMRHEDNPELTKSFDLLFRGVEVITGAQREHRHDVLLKQAEEKGMDAESLKDYTDFFRYGCPPHGGVGIGPGRIVMKLLDLASVKEATYLPRDVKRLRP